MDLFMKKKKKTKFDETLEIMELAGKVAMLEDKKLLKELAKK